MTSVVGKTGNQWCRMLFSCCGGLLGVLSQTWTGDAELLCVIEMDWDRSEDQRQRREVVVSNAAFILYNS